MFNKRSHVIVLPRVDVTALLPTVGVLLFLFLPYSQSAVSDALLMCAKRILPSLFPFMVAAGMISASRTADTLGTVALPVTKLFKLPVAAGTAYALSLISGFPIGAVVTAGLFRRGALSRYDAERLLALSCNTGPGFVVGAIGRQFFSSSRIGWYLYFVQIASTVIGCLFTLGRGEKVEKSAAELSKCEAREASLATAFSSSLTRAASSCVTVTGYIVFFAVIAEYIKMLLGNGIALAAVLSAVEVSAGISAAVSLPERIAFIISGFAVCFSGISVIAQAAAIADGEGLSVSRLIAAKSLAGVTGGALCALLAPFAVV